MDQTGLPDDPTNKPFNNVRKKLKKFKSASKLVDQDGESRPVNPCAALRRLNRFESLIL
jgi:hypothetical protein